MVTIDTVQPDDLPETAALHKAHLKLGLFPRMGRHFLCQYQETFAKSPYGIALVARSGERVVGALFGTSSNADHYSWVVRNCGWDLAFAGSGALLMRPQLAWTFASTRISRYARGLRRYITPSPPQSGTAPPLSVLSHIVTGECERRQGIGRQLIEEFKVLARAQGAHRAMLVTEEGGEGIPFFERIGCTCVSHRSGPDGSSVREYSLSLDEADAYENVDGDRYRPAAGRAYQPGFGAARTSRGDLKVH
jgi:GNAT superfamily N-acetyltransferase